MNNLIKKTSLGLTLTILFSTGAHAFCDFKAAKELVIKNTLEDKIYTEMALNRFGGKPVTVEISDIKTGAGASGDVTEVFITYTQTVSGSGNPKIDGVSNHVLKADFTNPGNCSVYNGSGMTVR